MTLGKRPRGGDSLLLSKRDKIAAIRYKLPHMTQSALVALCRYAASVGGLPDVKSSKELRDVRDGLCTVASPYGPLLVQLPARTSEGDEAQIEMLNPWAGLVWYLSASSFLANILQSLRESRQPKRKDLGCKTSSF